MSADARAPRGAYPRRVPLATRWGDNDVYGHVNAVVCYAFLDTAVNGLLIEAGALDIAKSAVIGLVVETGCRYRAPVAFSDPVTAGVRVARLGRSNPGQRNRGEHRLDALPASVLDRTHREPTPPFPGSAKPRTRNPFVRPQRPSHRRARSWVPGSAARIRNDGRGRPSSR